MGIDSTDPSELSAHDAICPGIPHTLLEEKILSKDECDTRAKAQGQYELDSLEKGQDKPFGNSARQQGNGLQSGEEIESEHARIERLGRQRPTKFKSFGAELAFCYSIIASQFMAVSSPPLIQNTS